MLSLVLSVGGTHEFICAKREAGLSRFVLGQTNSVACRKVVTFCINEGSVAECTPRNEQVSIALYTLHTRLRLHYKFVIALRCKITESFVYSMETHAVFFIHLHFMKSEIRIRYRTIYILAITFA
jgi:hypothetical protein